MYFYYQYNTSTVHTISKERCKNRIQASEIYAGECRERGFYERFQQEIDYKLFELGYRNTLYSYLQGVKKPEYEFVEYTKAFLEKYIPDIEPNTYYESKVDAEITKFGKLHRKSSRYFLWYYKMLNTYRRLRYGKR